MFGIARDVSLVGLFDQTCTDIFTGPGNCTDLVANNPEAFKNAYWEFGSFQVYQAK
jgi:hypothetical protein